MYYMISESDVIEYIPSMLVTPELEYIIAIPNNIKHEDKPPNKKYVMLNQLKIPNFYA